MDGLRAFCGDGLVLLCADWSTCLGLGAGLVTRCCYWFAARLEFELGLGLGLLTGFCFLGCQLYL